MKKAILTFALFSLVVLTSFTTSDTGAAGLSVRDTGGTGSGQTGQIGNGNTVIVTTKKLDYSVATVSNNENTKPIVESSK